MSCRQDRPSSSLISKTHVARYLQDTSSWNICKTDGLGTCVLAHMFQQEEIRLLQDTSSEKRRCVSCKTRDVSCKTDLPTHVARRGDRVCCKTDLARYERSHCAYKTMGCIRQESQPIVLYKTMGCIRQESQPSDNGLYQTRGPPLASPLS